MTHKDLEVWKEAMRLAKTVYGVTTSFPKDEIYGLTAQMRRAASIPSNIAEGAARSSKKEFIQFLYVALGSLAELETQWLLVKELGFCPHYPTDHASHLTNIDEQIKRVRMMLLGLLRHLKRQSL
ncbi:MAG TPA: four helix bundle protein [Thermodesulfobacteriota bacterium]|nr:four helix bundle protein [Thermodesulfobacteriota bacterium]